MEPTSNFVPITGNGTLDHVLTVLGVFMTLSSTAASFLNAKIRAALDEEEEVPRLFLYMGLIVNSLAFNVDKAGQMQRLLRGGTVTLTKVSANPEKKS